MKFVQSFLGTREENLDQGLSDWVNEMGIGKEQKASREEASERIKKFDADDIIFLNLDGLGLTSIPDAIKHLNLSNKPSIFLQLQNNKLSQIPESIVKIKDMLQLLDLSNNQFEKIPKEIGQLDKLSSLDLSNNKISEAPESIYNFTELTYLNLSNNEISEVPELIYNPYQFPKLEVLDLSNNEISEVSDQFFKNYNSELPFKSITSSNFSNFKIKVNLTNNPIKEPEILKKNAKEKKGLTLIYSDNRHLEGGNIPPSEGEEPLKYPSSEIKPYNNVTTLEEKLIGEEKPYSGLKKR